MLLIGSITFALMIMGLVVVFNGLIAPSPDVTDTSNDVDEAAEYNGEVRRNARTLLIHTNHQEVYASKSDLNDTAKRHFGNYSRLLAESYAASGPVYVNATYDGPVAYGHRTVQHEENDFTHGSNDWSPVDSPNEIGWFVVNLNLTDVSNDPFRIVVENDTGETMGYEFTKNGSTVTAVDIDVTRSGTPLAEATCQPFSGRTLLDLLDGESFTSSCSVPGVSAMDGPYEVTFEHGDRVRGKYSIVTRGAPNNGVPDCASPPQNPCRSPVVWSLNVTTTYESPGVSYTNGQNVSVYGGSEA